VLVLAGSSVRDVEQRVEHDVFGVIVLDGGAVDPPAKFQIDSNQTPNSFQSKYDERISLNGFFLLCFEYYWTRDSHKPPHARAINKRCASHSVSSGVFMSVSFFITCFAFLLK
jgi:hypothetical protein